MLVNDENRVIIIRLFKLLKPYINKISGIFICIVASTGISMLFPMLSKQIMGNGLLVQDFGVVIKFSLFTLGLVLIDQGIGIFETKYFSYVNAMFQYSLLKTAFKHLLKLKLQYFNNTNFSEIMGNIGMDVGNISRICDKGTFIIISQVFRIIGGVVGLLIIDWKLTIVVVLIVPIRYFTVKILRPLKGRIFLDGIDINELNLREYRNLISVVSQDLYLFNTTIEENISIGLKADKLKIGEAAKKSGAYDFIKEMPLRYKSEVGRNGSKLSGGQRQKVAMARAFARESKLLILDEATANYDMESESYVNQMLTTDFGNRTIIVISHKPDILSMVDKIWVMDSGKINEFKNYNDFESNCSEYKDFLYKEKSAI